MHGAAEKKCSGEEKLVRMRGNMGVEPDRIEARTLRRL